MGPYEFDLYEDELEGDDLLGEDLLGDDDLLGFSIGGFHVPFTGRKKRRRTSRRRGGLIPHARSVSRRVSPYRGAPRVLTKPALIGPAPGVPQISGLYIPLGLGSFDFTNGAGITARVFTERPEKPVRPRRLWINIARSAGAAGIGVDVTDIKIGTKSMLAGLLAIPAEQFAPGAFATSYNLFDSAVPGVSVSVSVSLSALPGAGENVFISMSMDCDSLG